MHLWTISLPKFDLNHKITLVLAKNKFTLTVTLGHSHGVRVHYVTRSSKSFKSKQSNHTLETLLNLSNSKIFCGDCCDFNHSGNPR